MSRFGLRAALLSAAALAASAAFAPVTAAASFSISTPYPAVTVDPGATVTFDIQVTTPSPERVTLAVSGAPASWSAHLTGGGNSIDAVYTATASPPPVQLSVKVPQDASAGAQEITVTATASEGTIRLPVTVTVAGTGGSGGVQLTAEFNKLSGAASSTFTYNLTLANNGSQKQTYTLTGQGPDGWQVAVHPSSNAQAVTDSVDGGGTDQLSVTATPPSGATAGAYQIVVAAAAGSDTATTQLEADITGAPGIKLSTPNQVLNAQVTAGGTGTFQVIVSNTGTTPLSGVSVTATPPSNWKVTFDTPTIQTLAPNDSKTVTATIQPAGDAIAGDYNLTVSASSGGVSDSLDIRTTVQASPLWGFIGIGVIALVLVGLAWAFRRYGRR